MIYYPLRGKFRNYVLLAASLCFYAYGEPKFVFIMAFSIALNYGIALIIDRCRKQAKLLLIISVILNVGILFVYKYLNFGISIVNSLFRTGFPTPEIALPIGISFFTFQAMSYVIDVYRGTVRVQKNPLYVALYISFFPQLVAGPIERATNLLPQFLQKRTFSYEQGVDGMRQILWGLFKKIVVADNCAMYVDQVWSTYDTQSGSTLLLAAILFTFQIYGDFSGYSDIAIGTAKLFGIKLMRNFSNPYFSRDIAEFWRRWHISLTTWFRDYVYIPLGGSRVGKWKIVRNTFVIFLLSGFWHGANWTFIVWGAYHAVLFLPLILLGMNRKYTNQVAEGMWLPTWKEAEQILLTFTLVVAGWIIFRAETIGQSWLIMGEICSGSLLTIPYLMTRSFYLPLFCSIAFMLLVEWLNRDYQHGLARVTKWSWVNVLFYYALIVVMYRLSVAGDVQFIYFQF